MASATAIDAEIQTRLSELKKVQKEIDELKRQKEAAPMEAEVELLRTMFAKIDVSGDGSIQASELKAFSEALGYAMTEEELEESFSQLDKDGSASLSFEELSEWWFSDASKSNCLPLRLLRARMGGKKFLEGLGVGIKALKETAQATSAAPKAEVPVVTPAKAESSSGVKIGFSASLGEKLCAETAPAGIMVRVGAASAEDRAEGSRVFVELNGSEEAVERAAGSIKALFEVLKVESKLQSKTDGMVQSVDVVANGTTLRVGITISPMISMILSQMIPSEVLATLINRLSLAVDVLFDPAPAPLVAPEGHKMFSQNFSEMLKAVSRLTLNLQLKADDGFFDLANDVASNIPPLAMAAGPLKSVSVFKGCDIALEFGTIQELWDAAAQSPMGGMLHILESGLPAQLNPDVLYGQFQSHRNDTDLKPACALLAIKSLAELDGPTRVCACIEVVKADVTFKNMSVTQFAKYLMQNFNFTELNEFVEQAKAANN